MRVIVASVRTPFVHGGAEIQAEQLVQALREAGHEAELVMLPFNAGEPERIPDQMLACSLFDLKKINEVEVDRVIALKFPAYFVQHPRKTVWLMHQHRPAYDLWDNPLGNLQYSPRGVAVRNIIRRADAQLARGTRIFTISKNVSARVWRFWEADSTPLYHPPANTGDFYCAKEAEDYFFFPSRISAHKRQELALRALAQTQEPVNLKFAGAADNPADAARLQHLARELGLEPRVTWRGYIQESEKRDLYARCLAVLYPTFDEDYGYVTLEAMLSSKGVITCEDSGGPLEFVLPNETGLVTAPDPASLAAAMDQLWRDRALAAKFGRAGRRSYDKLDLTWSKVVKQLLA